jgi:hypothetical protein
VDAAAVRADSMQHVAVTQSGGLVLVLYCM